MTPPGPSGDTPDEPPSADVSAGGAGGGDAGGEASAHPPASLVGLGVDLGSRSQLDEALAERAAQEGVLAASEQPRDARETLLCVHSSVPLLPRFPPSHRLTRACVWCPAGHHPQARAAGLQRQRERGGGCHCGRHLHQVLQEQRAGPVELEQLPLSALVHRRRRQIRPAVPHSVRPCTHSSHATLVLVSPSCPARACLTLAGHASPPLPTAWCPSSWASSPFSWPSCRSTI